MRKKRDDEQLQKTIEESVLAHKKELNENKLKCLDDLKSHLHLLQAKKHWSVVNADGCVIVAHIEATMEEAPNLISSVVISSNMCVCVFVEGARLMSDEPLSIPEVLNGICVLVQLLNNIQEYCAKRELEQDEKVNGKLKLVISLLDISTEDLLEHEKVDAIMFLREQCQLLMRQKKKYLAELLVLSTIFHTISPHSSPQLFAKQWKHSIALPFDNKTCMCHL